MNNRSGTRRPRDTSLALLLACWLLGGLAVAQEQNQAAKAAAQAVGSVGQAAARAVARDASQPLNVPGFEGTDLAEADHTATGMDVAARRALADPNDAGGAVGRAVVDGTLSRRMSPCPRLILKSSAATTYKTPLTLLRGVPIASRRARCAIAAPISMTPEPAGAAAG